MLVHHPVPNEHNFSLDGWDVFFIAFKGWWSWKEGLKIFQLWSLEAIVTGGQYVKEIMEDQYEEPDVADRLARQFKAPLWTKMAHLIYVAKVILVS